MLNADFNFPKIHLMSDWVKQVRRYRAWQQYSAERHEQAHKTNLMDGCNASNHNLNNLPQVIIFHRRILCFEVRELNLQSLTLRQENSAAACKVLPSGADLATHLSPQSSAKSEFMGPQNLHDGKYPEATITDFRALSDKTQEAMHRVPISCSMPQLIPNTATKVLAKQKQRNKSTTTIAIEK
jgi:hypothetical protein